LPETFQESMSTPVADLFSIAGKVALITGGSRGIGAMIARGFVEAGAKVYITSRKASACEDLAAELSAKGECTAIPADISKPEDRKRLVEEITKRDTALNILVNSAGTVWGAKLDEFPDEGFRKVVDLNLNALFSVTRDCIPLLEKGGSKEDPARIISIGSMDGLRAPTVSQTGTFPYVASKAAVHHLTRAFAIDLAPRNITANAIAPGFFHTKMTEFVVGEFRADIERNCPLSRLGAPEEMVGVAIYLASRAGAYTNGAVIPVDGGTHIA